MTNDTARALRGLLDTVRMAAEEARIQERSLRVHNLLHGVGRQPSGPPAASAQDAGDRAVLALQKLSAGLSAMAGHDASSRRLRRMPAALGGAKTPEAVQMMVGRMPGARADGRGLMFTRGV